jgi:sugar (pentulose or hexulose) kinase
LAYALREGKERIARRGRFDITALRVAGGGSQSDAAMQLTADIFDLPAQRPHVYEASGLGAAIDAAAGLRLHGSFETAVSAMTRVSRTFEPQAKNTALYDALYERIYRRMYARLMPLYGEIAQITGYPPSPDACE